MHGSRRAPRPRSTTSARTARLDAAEVSGTLRQLRLALQSLPALLGHQGRVEALGATWRWWSAEYLPRLSDAKCIRRRWERYLAPHVAHLMPWDVTPALVARVLDLVPRGPRTINAVRETLRAVIAAAIANGRWPMGNPVSAVHPRKVPRRRWPTLSVPEARALLSSAVEPYRSIWDVAVHLGPRRGELYALTVSDIDQVARTLRVHKSHERQCTKNGLERTIPIPAELWPCVAELVRAALARQLATGKPGDPLLFPNPQGGMRNRREKLTERLRSDLARAGIVVGWDHKCRRCKTVERRSDASPTCCNTCGETRRAVGVPRALRAHDLRHSFTTLLLEAGADREVIRMTLGHAGDTTSIYTDVSLERQRTELEKLALAKGYTPPLPHDPHKGAGPVAATTDPAGAPRNASPEATPNSTTTKAETRNRTGDLLITNHPLSASAPDGIRNPGGILMQQCECGCGPIPVPEPLGLDSDQLARITADVDRKLEIEHLEKSLAASFGLPAGKRVGLPSRGVACACGALAALTLNTRPLCEQCFNRALACDGLNRSRLQPCTENGGAR